MRKLLFLVIGLLAVSGCAATSALEQRVAALEEQMLFDRTEQAGKKWKDYTDITPGGVVDADSLLIYDVDGAAAWKLYELPWSSVKAQLDIDGLEVPVVPKSGDFDLDTAANARGQLYVNTQAGTTEFQLPPAEAGLCACFYASTAQVIEVAPDTGDGIVLSGTALTSEHEMDSPGAIGDFVCIVALDNTWWHTLGMVGAWVTGGEAD